MSNEVKLLINSKLDDKGFRQLDANLKKAQTSAVGLGKSAANAFGSSMGPAGELLSQVSNVSTEIAALGGAGVAKVGAFATAIVFTTSKVKELYETIVDTNKAAEDLARSGQTGRTTAGNIASSIMSEGIQPGSQSAALANLESAAKAARFTGQSEAEQRAIDKARDFILSGAAETLGGQKTFERNLSPSAKKALQEQSLMENYGGKSVGELQRIIAREERDKARGQQIGGAEGAAIVNRSQAVIDEVQPFLEAVSKAFAEELAAQVSEEADQIRKDTENINQEFKNLFGGSGFPTAEGQGGNSIQSVMANARQRIGGSSNAPILSTWQTMSELQKQTAANTAAIARNTARGTLPATPVSPALPRQ